MADNSKKNEKNEEHGEPVEKEEETETKILKRQIEDLENQVKRILADYQNLVKRTRHEKESWVRLSNRELILRLLPVLDTLVLAKKHSVDPALSLVTQQFLDVLKNEGVERIDTKDKDFDPSLMECIQTKEGKDWKVLDEARMGFRSKDVILRPAQVIVGKE